MKNIVFIILIALGITCITCKKDNPPAPPSGKSNQVSVSCDSISDITPTTAIVYSTLKNPLNDSISYGICWSEDTMPDVNRNSITVKTALSAGSFSATITNLSNQKKYYLKAWSKKQDNVIYSGKKLELATMAVNFSLNNPVVNGTSVVFKGKVSATVPLKRFGVCYASTTTLPTLSNYVKDTLINNAGLDFNFLVTGLKVRLYNARGFAVSKWGFVLYSDSVLTFSVN